MRYINLPFTAAYSIQPENDGVRGQRDKIATTNFTAVGLPAVNCTWPPLYSLPFIYPTSLMPSDAPWRLTYEIAYLTRRSNARRACMLHPVEGLLAEPSVGKQAALTCRLWCRAARLPSDSNHRTSVSVPYSSPMFDVQDVSRFYRCSISDVHIGRSLMNATHRLKVRQSNKHLNCTSDISNCRCVAFIIPQSHCRKRYTANLLSAIWS